MPDSLVISIEAPSGTSVGDSVSGVFVGIIVGGASGVGGGSEVGGVSGVASSPPPHARLANINKIAASQTKRKFFIFFSFL
jgi:hypothetical protein